MNAQLIAMCYMCVMMTEIETIEGGQKRCLLTRGDKKKESKRIRSPK